ncbi:hypothetical protein CMI37_26660 [Candidatus Pacearchaeota archaeon]|nr:hypothetical protein [Candidatus Pacearchaeota archaeon]|tara:strand:+ start:6825 stop:7415 length:591 start_codon:yes stop_codon:yes gene_type:complete
MVIKYLISGFLVKIITGFDDTLTHIPVAANVTKKKVGRIAFATGILLAISLAIIFSILFASAIKLIPYYKYISAGLILLLAITIYFDLFIHIPQKKVEKKLKRKKRISTTRYFKLLGIGFITAVATVIDDTIAYSSLFLTSLSVAPLVVLGIFMATITQLTILIYFSKKVQKIKWKKEITVFGLIILAILIFFGVL